MKAQTELLICIGAATAANCVPCYEHYHAKAQALDLDPESIQQAVALASKVKRGAHFFLKNHIAELAQKEGQVSDCTAGESPCCG